MDKNLFKVKLYIKAKTEDELVIAQLANNRRHDTMFEYNVLWNGKEYVAWFTADLSKMRRENVGSV